MNILYSMISFLPYFTACKETCTKLASYFSQWTSQGILGGRVRVRVRAWFYIQTYHRSLYQNAVNSLQWFYRQHSMYQALISAITFSACVNFGFVFELSTTLFSWHTMHSLLCILYVVKLKLYKKWNKCLQLDYLLSQSIFLRVETVCCSVHTHDQSLCRILLCHYLCRTGCALDDFLHSHWAQKWKQDNKNMKGVTMYAFEVFKTGMKNLIVRWRWLKARFALKTFSAGQCKSMQMSSQLLAYHVFRKVWLDLLNIHVQTRIFIGWNSSGIN